ncbi:carboxylesterase [Paenibacillus sambharensis]|uniref:Carboxylesterase n=1 Tax=Paenibacillus sambharensis TaxID=1803190 RepID=A0A2W1LN54_9BACL|nr:alpha/beta hydrolase [Paenibacillus sambharensis]PZD95884.1 carboxylesterase [Paenibacillus sambharensis]
MQHVFEQGTDVNAPVLVMFHGTGGTERDLLPLAKAVSPSSSVLSLRGNVLENGMPRFFRRLAEGVFDEEDLVFRTKEVYDFLLEAADRYEVDRNNMVAVGYSNGANIAGSLLFHYEHVFRAAILHHPMVPIRGLKLPNLTGTSVFIGAGSNDPLCTPQETEELEQLLRDAGSDVTVHWERYGHQLTGSEVEAAADWYRGRYGNS